MSASPRFTFDTNVLFYAADRNAGHKHGRALELIEAAAAFDCILTLQCLGELMNSIIKLHVVQGDRAEQIIAAYRASFPVVPALEGDIDRAILAHRLHGIPFWDAMLWATALRAGCTVLLTEDLQDGRTLEALRSETRSLRLLISLT